MTTEDVCSVMSWELESAIGGLFAVARTAEDAASDNRSLSRITQALSDLASRRSLFDLDQFPLHGRRSILYVLARDDYSDIVLYAARSTPVSELPEPRPHNHTTWAAISTVYGEELQLIYDRTDDGSVPGHGTLRRRREYTVRPGASIGYQPEEFHSVAAVGSGAVLALHLYGRGLDQLTERIVFAGDEGGRYEPFLLGPDLFTQWKIAR